MKSKGVVIFFSVPRLECPGEGPLFELDSNKRWGRNAATIRVISLALIEVRPGALGQILPHQETISGRPEQVYLSFDQDWNDLEGGHYLSRTRINTAGPKCGHYSN